MAFQASTVPFSMTPHSAWESKRPLAKFKPSFWGDYFLSYSSTTLESSSTSEEYDRLKEKVRKMLISSENKLIERLNLIDAAQRLGLSYHFTKEIYDALQKISHDKSDRNHDESNTLHLDSLRFRLLRQHGFNASCDVFMKFKNDQGEFKESITSDIRGMLSLYEATYLAVHGEDILDDALVFTKAHLQSKLCDISCPSLAKQVVRALYRPNRKCLERLETVYQIDDSHNETLLKFAKLDYNKVQQMHQKEIGIITKWWKDLDICKNFPFIRDRIVELYFWSNGVYYEPCYQMGRRFFAKVIAITSIIDDTYDAYGTLEELELFTEAIQRWDISAIDVLPDYMKVLYKALLEVYDEIEKVTTKEGRSYCVHYATEAMKRLTRAYFLEAQWRHEGYVPTIEEYMDNAHRSTGYFMLATTSFVGMNDFGTEEALEWVSNYPKIVKAASAISRLMDDMVSHKFEQEREHVASAVECYRREHEGVTENQVCDLFLKRVEDAWKDINEEFLEPDSPAIPLLTRILNLARVMDFIYKEEDGYTNSSKHLRDAISALFIYPVPV